MNPKPYKTLLTASSKELVINKSRFICQGFPVDSEQAALENLKRVRGIYQDATHNCYAYAVGANMGIMRYSDDGEPGGTAGMPIMEVVKTRQVTNCLIVITRYFGGVLLGAGGLVRAYSQSAALAIDSCGVGTVYPTTRLEATIGYSLLGRAEHFLKSQSAILEDKQFSDAVKLILCVKQSEEAAFTGELTAALDGKVNITKTDEFYKAWNE